MKRAPTHVGEGARIEGETGWVVRGLALLGSVGGAWSGCLGGLHNGHESVKKGDQYLDDDQADEVTNEGEHVRLLGLVLLTFLIPTKGLKIEFQALVTPRMGGAELALRCGAAAAKNGWLHDGGAKRQKA
jgi:hypothetical protein